MKLRLMLPLALISFQLSAQKDSLQLRKLSDDILLRGTCYENLRHLCKDIGHRLSGTPEAARAVAWGVQCLKDAGADTVFLQPVEVPVWRRGKETLKLDFGKGPETVPMLSLGNSEGTSGKWLEAEIVMADDFDAFAKLRPEDVKGKIVFFNHRFRQELVNTFNGYGEAGRYRWGGPNVASAAGAAAVIIRSVSTGVDDQPHTGSMRYADTVSKIPAIAIGNTTADRLEAACKARTCRAKLRSECHMDGTAPSFNVVGELRGTQHPNEIVLVGGHLDSWDVGEGAQDDGAGCAQSIEVLRAIKATGTPHKRTIRAVLFMNEENGLRGGQAYADSAKKAKTKHILAVETDAGGFSPRGIGTEMPDGPRKKVQSWAPLFAPYGVYDFDHDEGGADIGPLHKLGVPAAGLLPDPQRYFDLHHTNADVFESVNHRELKLGAFTLAGLVYLTSEYGLD